MIGLRLKGPDGLEQYSVDSEINSGGFGKIYLGYDLLNKHKIAVKIIPINDQQLFDTLKREVDISITLDHENIIKTYYSGVSDNNNYFYLIMEYIPKGSLDSFLKSQNNYLPLDLCLKLFDQIADGLAYAHKYIIHRDLKPNNILIDKNDRIKICDFGLSKYVDESTRAFSFKGDGTFAYMSPEAWQRLPNSIPMDIYSLGIIFFEILALKKPFNGNSQQEYRNCHLFELLPDLSSIRSDVSIKLKEIITKMTNKKSNERFQSVDELILSLKQLSIDSNKNDNLVDSIANMAHELIKKKEDAIGKDLRENDVHMEMINIINYSINELFNHIETLVKSINSKLENHKITFYKTKRRELYCLHLSFMERTLDINFFNVNEIKFYKTNRNKKSIEFQIQKYGMVLKEPGDTVFDQEHILIVGMMKINVPNKNFSVNLLLRKEQQFNIYGEWYYAVFKDSVFTPTNYRENYTLDRNDFYHEYQMSRAPGMHTRTVETNKIDSNEIQKWLRFLLE